MNYYAVARGRHPGVYTDWASCEKEVRGFKNARYKKFKTKEEAEEFVRLGERKPEEKPSSLRAYVDGSFNIKTQEYGYGIVLLWEKEREEYFAKGERADFARHRNVAGEVLGAMEAINIALARGEKDLTLYYDYAGIAHWALGEWKRNTELTRMYYEFFQNKRDKLHVEFVKVQAHSGDRENEAADLLAKKAVGIQK